MKHSFIFLIFICLLASAISTQRAQAHSPFIVVTPEKSGTHLLTKLMSRLVKKEVLNCWEHEMNETELTQLLDAAEQNNSYVHMHALPTEEIIQTLKKKGYKVIFLMRDPRDLLISLLHYIEKGWSFGPCSLDRPYGQLSLKDKLHELITGERFGLSAIPAIIIRRLPWMDQESTFVYTAYFEQLVGKEGGGNDRDQLREIVGIAGHINLKLDKTHLKEVSTHLWGADPGEKTTFRNGQTGSWKAEFTERHKRSFKKRFNRLLIETGYEKNSEW